MSRDVIDRLDALIHKRRSYVAKPATAESIAAPAPATQTPDVPFVENAPHAAEPPPAVDYQAAPPDDDDVPILTEVVDVPAVSADQPAAVAHAPLEPLLDAMANDLTLLLQQRMAQDLPPVLEQAFARFGDELRRGIAEIAENAARDFVARRSQLHLPFATAPAAETGPVCNEPSPPGE